MRDILFRARTVSESEYLDDGEWIEGFYTCFNGEEHRIYTGYSETDCGDHYPDWFTVLPETVGQYTGLTDKNGKKIFEGDICQTKGFPLVDEKPFVIEWNSDECSFYWRDVAETNEFTIRCSQCTTVIGNIHDNRLEDIKSGVELSEGCKKCVHSPVCYEIENLHCRKDFLWYQAESGCPHYTRTPKERGGEK